MAREFEDTFKHLIDAREKEKAAQREDFEQYVLRLCEERGISFEDFPQEEYEELWRLTQSAEKRLDEIIYEDEDSPVFQMARTVKKFNDRDIDTVRNSRYELNHTKITCCIYEHLKNYKAFPLVSVIVEITGLSRTTVHKHLKSIKKESYTKRYQESIEITRRMILEQLAGKFMGEGDLKSAALYLRFTEEKHVNIQLNNITLNKQVINNLSQGQVEAIETIIIGEEE